MQGGAFIGRRYAERSGRLTLEPWAHIDPLARLCWFCLGLAGPPVP